MARQGPLPNFVFLGAPKTGSTWLASYLAWHPQAYVTPAKDLYFFDLFFDRGEEWYRQQFTGWDGEPVIAEVCHNYLYSPAALLRIAEVLPADARFMVTLREPVDRVVSGYRYHLKLGNVTGTLTEALRARPDLLDPYAEHLANAVTNLGRARLHVSLFDDLKADVDGFASSVTGFLGIDDLTMPEEVKAPKLAAQASRSPRATQLASKAAWAVRRFGVPGLVGRVKGNALVKKVLYRPLAAGEGSVTDDERAWLREACRADVVGTSDVLGMDLVARWGYDR